MTSALNNSAIHSDGGGGGPQKFDGKVRFMLNGDVALPFSVAFVLKKFENFDVKKCTLDLKLTMVMRIKFNGLDRYKSPEQM